MPAAEIRRCKIMNSSRMKPRSDSTLERLPAEVRGRLHVWLEEENRSCREVVRLLAAEFGVVSSRSAVSRYYRRRAGARGEGAGEGTDEATRMLAALLGGGIRGGGDAGRIGEVSGCCRLVPCCPGYSRLRPDKIGGSLKSLGGGKERRWFCFLQEKTEERQEGRKLNVEHRTLNFERRRAESAGEGGRGG